MERFYLAAYSLLARIVNTHSFPLNTELYVLFIVVQWPQLNPFPRMKNYTSNPKITHTNSSVSKKKLTEKLLAETM